MRFIGFIIAILVVFGSVMPHAALAHQHPVAAPSGHQMSNSHEIGKPHSTPLKDCAGCKGDCVGCAAPVQMVATLADGPVLAGPRRVPFLPDTLAAFIASLELPPPRSIA